LRAKAMPGEVAENLPQPAEVAADLLPLLKPDILENGKLFDRVSKDWVSP
jgi:hypothetical protein